MKNRPAVVAHAYNPSGSFERLRQEDYVFKASLRKKRKRNQGTKQFSEILSLNKIQNRAGDVAQWFSAPEFNPHTKKEEEKK